MDRRLYKPNQRSHPTSWQSTRQQIVSSGLQQPIWSPITNLITAFEAWELDFLKSSLRTSEGVDCSYRSNNATFRSQSSKTSSTILLISLECCTPSPQRPLLPVVVFFSKGGNASLLNDLDDDLRRPRRDVLRTPNRFTPDTNMTPAQTGLTCQESQKQVLHEKRFSWPPMRCNRTSSWRVTLTNETLSSTMSMD